MYCNRKYDLFLNLTKNVWYLNLTKLQQFDIKSVAGRYTLCINV